MATLEETSLALMFTGGVGLKTWAEIGMLQRELAIYHRLRNRLQQVTFVTYGGKGDWQYADQLGKIGLLSTTWTPYQWLNYKMLWYHHRRALSKLHILKTNQIWGADIALWLKRRCRCKLITRCGYLQSLFFEHQAKNKLALQQIKSLEQRAFTEADLGIVTTVSALEQVVERYRIDRQKIRVVPNYVDVEFFRPPPETPKSHGQPTLLFVGRLEPQKNITALVHALSILKGRRRVVPQLILVGNGQLRAVLEEESARRDLPVLFRGNLPWADLHKEMWNADVFVLPSLYEGHPKALLEAMACGMPCIGTAVDGIVQEICHKENGYLCQPNPEDLADAIDAVFSDEGLQRKMGIGARRHIVGNYALDRVFELEIDAIRSVL